MGWDIRTDSPLLGGDPGARRLRFDVAQPHPGEAGPLPYVSSLLAGSAEVDITPPPGMPKAGYSSNATDGKGFRTRLRARVLHLRRGHASVAIVQCDLLGGSAVLSHLVARHLAGRTDIALAGLMIGATHTHAGPGQFLGTDFYNRFASNRPGFDPGWTQFLAQRIADAVIEAVDTRVPAAMAVGSAPVWGFTRNRSLDPHVRNPEVSDKRLDPQRKWINVDPVAHVVRVDAVDGGSDGNGGMVGRPLAAMVVFGVHGTGISMRAPEYNADLWGYVVGEMADRIESASGHRAVVGAIEGTHADIAPAIRPGRAGHLEARRVGQGIGAAAAGLWEQLGGRLSADVDLAAGFCDVDLDAGGDAIDAIVLPRRPAVGAALVAGAHENVTPVLHRLPPFRPGMPKPWRTGHPQGPKWVLGSRWLQPALLPLRGFPRVLPIQVVRLGSATLVGLPFEVTVGAGRRIAAEVSAAMTPAGEAPDDEARDSGAGDVIVSSVANDYAGYVVTPEEYQRQHYEGGHTLYGPLTQPFVAAHAARLAAAVVAAGGHNVQWVAPRRQFDLRVRRYLPPSIRVPVGAVGRTFDAAAVFTDPDDDHDAVWSQDWFDAEPGALNWHEPLVIVEVAHDGEPNVWRQATTADHRTADDQGWALEVVHVGEVTDAAAAVDPGTHRYRVRWHTPLLAAGVRHRFVLLANAGRPRVDGPMFC